MDASDVICCPAVLRRLHHGPFGTQIDRLAATYLSQGYSRLYVRDRLTAAGRFGRWLGWVGLTASDVNEALAARYLATLSPPPPGLGGVLDTLLTMLRADGVAPTPVVVLTVDEQCVESFRQYLVSERGLAARTIGHYAEAAATFLAARRAVDARPASQWTAADVLAFLRQEAGRRPSHALQHLCTGVRAFLRYLRWRGEVQSDLAANIPRIAHWRLTSIPKGLTPEQLERVLAVCDRSTAVGRRDYALLLLLSRLGLRAQEISRLTLDDIDWRRGELTIRGKCREIEQMPLPSDVGAALAAYLLDGRPATSSREVFMRLVVPHRPMVDSRSVITVVVRAMRKARIDAPVRGAHVFRHTLATQMLRGGASLREIGQILRHRDEDTTRLYAKVDLARLRTLAMPWPGGVA